MARALFVDKFSHDGRGPDLQEIFWSRKYWPYIRAINYFNYPPGGSNENTPLMHVRFKNPQAVLITPEEVIGLGQIGDYLTELAPASMFDLGRSPWLQSFSETHLQKCSHSQLLFYDHLFDVIAEGVHCREGGYGGVR